MIRVTIDLCPGGNEDPKAVVHKGTLKIWNDLEQSEETEGRLGSYKATLSKWHHPKNVWKKGKVRDFNRRTRGPYDLLFLALLDSVGRRNFKQIREAMDVWGKGALRK